MWICRRCGERNEDGSRACGNCAGTDVLVCPRCRSEYRGGVLVCADCGLSLADPAKLQDTPRPGGKPVKIWSSMNPTQADVMRIVLGRAGIESRLENQGGAHLVLGMGNPLGSYVITVAEQDAARAREVIRADLETAPESGHPDRYFPPVAMIQWPCACGQTLEVPPDFDGLEMDCPFCGRAVRAGREKS